MKPFFSTNFPWSLFALSFFFAKSFMAIWKFLRVASLFLSEGNKPLNWGEILECLGVFLYNVSASRFCFLNVSSRAISWDNRLLFLISLGNSNFCVK